jgi:ABC-2 type transport system permease protein
MGAESLAWALIFVLAPVSGVYYPVSTLPAWLQWVSWALPSAHTFEGMRAVMFEGTFPLGHFLAAIGLNVVYLLLGAAAFLYSFRVARHRGALLQMGE